MKAIFTPIILSCCICSAHGQVISRYNWNSSVPSVIAGPKASVVNGAAVTIPGSPTFDVPAIDVSIQFRKLESNASLFTRGESLDMGFRDGKLFVKFRVSNGGGGFTAIQSGPIGVLPEDAILHTYRFVYNDANGTAKVSLDGELIYTYNGIGLRSLYWTGAGNVEIGRKTGDDVSPAAVIFDKLIVQAPVNTLAPVRMINFTAERKSSVIHIGWTGEQEEITSYYSIERSSDGHSFTSIGRVVALGEVSPVNDYKAVDSFPLQEKNFYRLKTTSLDGRTQYSNILSLSRDDIATESRIFPNPATGNNINVAQATKDSKRYVYSFYTMDGKMVGQENRMVSAGGSQVDLSLPADDKKNPLVLKISDNTGSSREVFTILRN